jgi:hypothetical protein
MVETPEQPPKRGRGGSKPGERRGGRQKGTPHKATQARRDIAKALTHPETKAAIGELLHGEILKPANEEEIKSLEQMKVFLRLLSTLVEKYGPDPNDKDGKFVDEERFFKCLDYALECGRAVMPFEHPTFKATILNEIDQKNRDQPLMLNHPKQTKGHIGPMQ